GRVEAGLPNPVVEFAAGLGGLTLLLLAAAVGLLRDGAVVVIVRDEAGHAAEEVAASVGDAGADLLGGVAGDREGALDLLAGGVGEDADEFVAAFGLAGGGDEGEAVLGEEWEGGLGDVHQACVGVLVGPAGLRGDARRL